MDRFDAGPQPAGRPPAPGRLAYVQALLNSFWDLERHGGDTWSTPSAYGAWLAARGFGDRSAGPDDLAEAMELREALRALALANHAGAPPPHALATLDAVAARVGPQAALTPLLARAPGELEPATAGPEAALALALAVVLVARTDGTWRRLKACPHARCGWAFYDTSRNRSGQWCSMRICGNRTKGDAFRARRRRRDQVAG